MNNLYRCLNCVGVSAEAFSLPPNAGAVVLEKNRRHKIRGEKPRYYFKKLVRKLAKMIFCLESDRFSLNSEFTIF